MLRDKSRTLAYKDFIMGNSDFFKDKIVMDIGCGTGVLSIFAAKSGAKHVIAIDMSNIAKKAKVIIKNNGLQNKITVIQNKLEDIKSLPNGIEKVDIIILIQSIDITKCRYSINVCRHLRLTLAILYIISLWH